MKVYLRPFQRIVRLYRDSNPRRVEMKDDSPFRHTLAGFEPTLDDIGILWSQFYANELGS